MGDAQIMVEKIWLRVKYQNEIKYIKIEKSQLDIQNFSNNGKLYRWLILFIYHFIIFIFSHECIWNTECQRFQPRSGFER